VPVEQGYRGRKHDHSNLASGRFYAMEFSLIMGFPECRTDYGKKRKPLVLYELVLKSADLLSMHCFENQA
jgi:hypothetical protein